MVTKRSKKASSPSVTETISNGKSSETKTDAKTTKASCPSETKPEKLIIEPCDSACLSQDYLQKGLASKVKVARSEISQDPNPYTRSSSKSREKAPDNDAIAKRAWEIWQREGCPEGREMDHWLQAERELSE